MAAHDERQPNSCMLPPTETEELLMSDIRHRPTIRTSWGH
jgi:hypothetical protein